MSEKYIWKNMDRGTITGINAFEVDMTGTAEKARALRNHHGWSCRWIAIVAAHTETDKDYYTAVFEELRFTSLLPIGLGAEGVAYFVFDWLHRVDNEILCTDDIYRNSTTRQNISDLKSRVDWLRGRLLGSYTYTCWKRNTLRPDGWEWYHFSGPESEHLDSIEESEGQVADQFRRLTMGGWHGVTGHEAWPITSRDPWRGNYGYTAYFKGNTQVIWDGDDKGNLTQFSFTMPPGDTKLLELWPVEW